MAVKRRILQIVGVVIPSLSCCRVADCEDGRSIALCHLRCQGCVVLSVSCGQNRDIDAILAAVIGCKRLPCFVSLRLEVQQINLAGTRIKSFCGSFCLACHRSCGKHACCHCSSHKNTYGFLFHVSSSPLTYMILGCFFPIGSLTGTVVGNVVGIVSGDD